MDLFRSGGYTIDKYLISCVEELYKILYFVNKK